MMKLSTMWNVHRLDGPAGRGPLAERIARSLDLADEPAYPTWLRTLRGKLATLAASYRESFAARA